MKRALLLFLLAACLFTSCSAPDGGPSSGAPPPSGETVSASPGPTGTPTAGPSSAPGHTATPTPEQTAAPEDSPPPGHTPESTAGPDRLAFGPDDAEMAGVRLDVRYEEAAQLLGEPSAVEKIWEDAFPGEVWTCTYAFGSVRYDPLGETEHTAAGITVNKPGWDGPRGLRVGDEIAAVLAGFPDERTPGDETAEYLYGDDNSLDGCRIERDGAGAMTGLSFYYGQGFGAYTLYIDIRDGVVISMHLHVLNV